MRQLYINKMKICEFVLTKKNCTFIEINLKKWFTFFNWINLLMSLILFKKATLFTH